MFLSTLLTFCFLLITVNGQSCANRMLSQAECKGNIILSKDYDTLIQKKMPIIQRCAQMNETFQTCATQIQAMMTCKKQLAQMMVSDPTIEALKRQTITDVDQCFQAGRYPRNPFFVTMMMDGPPHGKKGPRGPGGMMGPPPPGRMGGPPPPPGMMMGPNGMFGPPMMGPPNMDNRGQFMAPGPLPEPNRDFSNMENGENEFQEKPKTSTIQDFTSCMQTLIKAAFQSTQGSPRMLNGDTSAPWNRRSENVNRPSGNDFHPRDMAGGPEPRDMGRGGKEKMKKCKPFIECVMTGEMQMSSDKEVMTVAQNVFESHQKCESDNKMTFDCIPSNMDLDKCIMTAMKPVMEMKHQKMAECMKQQGADMDIMPKMLKMKGGKSASSEEQ